MLEENLHRPTLHGEGGIECICFAGTLGVGIEIDIRTGPDAEPVRWVDTRVVEEGVRQQFTPSLIERNLREPPDQGGIDGSPYTVEGVRRGFFSAIVGIVNPAAKWIG